MLDFARLPVADRAPYILEVASRRRLTPRIVEKDFWVCFALRLLFSIPELRGRFVFKGGTSLSKVFGIIKRFSEDVDLSVDPDWLGFGGKDRPDEARSRSQLDRRMKQLGDACSAAVEQRIQPAMEDAVRQVLDARPEGGPYFAFEIDVQSHSPILIFRYPTTESDTTAYLRPQVKLELGSLTDQRPHGTHEVTPWVAEEFPKAFASPSCPVVALEVERTFWEKVTILHAEHHRPAGKPMRSRFSRDCYDVCCMAAHPAGRAAMKDLDLLARVVRHKQMFFPSSWASYGTAVPGTLRLVPPAHRMSDLKADYQQMQEMFTEAPPPFDALMEQLRGIEAQLNGG
jgi:hypothetical protein